MVGVVEILIGRVQSLHCIVLLNTSSWPESREHIQCFQIQRRDGRGSVAFTEWGMRDLKTLYVLGLLYHLSKSDKTL